MVLLPLVWWGRSLGKSPLWTAAIMDDVARVMEGMVQGNSGTCKRVAVVTSSGRAKQCVSSQVSFFQTLTCTHLPIVLSQSSYVVTSWCYDFAPSFEHSYYTKYLILAHTSPYISHSYPHITIHSYRYIDI